MLKTIPCGDAYPVLWTKEQVQAPMRLSQLYKHMHGRFALCRPHSQHLEDALAKMYGICIPCAPEQPPLHLTDHHRMKPDYWHAVLQGSHCLVTCCKQRSLALSLEAWTLQHRHVHSPCAPFDLTSCITSWTFMQQLYRQDLPDSVWPQHASAYVDLSQLYLSRALLAAHSDKANILASELDRAGLLATPERPQPRGMVFSDLPVLTYLDGVRFLYNKPQNGQSISLS